MVVLTVVMTAPLKAYRWGVKRAGQWGAMTAALMVALKAVKKADASAGLSVALWVAWMVDLLYWVQLRNKNNKKQVN
jgi:hypothetical protein